MSLSDATRREDKKRTLINMLREVADHQVWQAYFSAEHAEVAETLQTTWRELLDERLVTDKPSVMGQARYSLTHAGWLRAVIISGDVDTSAIRDRCSRLAKALKRAVKGRKSHYDEFVSVDAVASDQDLPAGWIVNAIQSRLLGVVFPDDKWDAQMDGNTIRVSPTFGLNHLFDQEG